MIQLSQHWLLLKLKFTVGCKCQQQAGETFLFVFLFFKEIKQRHTWRWVASTYFIKITDHFRKKFGHVRHSAAMDFHEAFYSITEWQQVASGSVITTEL